ncbi:hypothetical protein BKA83DRAFT_4486430 [Pisolithus microcarpus]|nr:hypothetical protein BKA83DRAFT_4486430 [Pisolithus microcarpus]
MHNPPSLWITVNPCDLHDPIAPVFAGKRIDMEQFIKTLGPSKEDHAHNVAADPYAAAHFFHFMICTIMEMLFGITATPHQVFSTKGIFRYMNAYFSVVESQGRGSLHLHMLLWLKGVPTMEKMEQLLKEEDFHERARTFIWANIRAYMPGLEKAHTISQIPNEVDVAYSRPPQPSSGAYVEDLASFESYFSSSLLSPPFLGAALSLSLTSTNRLTPLTTQANFEPFPASPTAQTPPFSSPCCTAGSHHVSSNLDQAPRTFKAGRQTDRLRNNDEQCIADVRLMAAEDQDTIDRMFEDQGMNVENGKSIPFSSPGSDSDYGNDDEFSGLPEHVSGWYQADCRDRRDRIELQINHWDAQMPCLVEAYLDFHSRSSDNGFSVEEHPEAFVMPENHSPDIITEIELVDIFSRRKASLMARPHHTFPNKNLIYHGYLGCSPIYPTIAISLCTLAIFRQACH